MLYLSGEIATGKDGKIVSGGIEEQAKQVMENIRQKLMHHDLAMDSVIKCTVFLAAMAEWPTFNKIYAGYFEAGRYPARSALAAAGLALGARLEVECLAALK